MVSLAMRDAFSHENAIPGTNSITGVLEFSLTNDELRAGNGVNYFRDIDRLISVHGAINMPPHPYSEFGHKYNLIVNDVNINDTEKFTLSIQLVDNAGRYNQRYINIHSKVFPIPPIMSTTQCDGLWITHTGAITADGENPIPRTECYPVDSCEYLPTYATFEEAKTLGDGDAIKRRELEEYAAGKVLIERELEELRASNKRWELEETQKLVVSKAEAVKEIQALELAHKAELRKLEVSITESDELRKKTENTLQMQTLEAKAITAKEVQALELAHKAELRKLELAVTESEDARKRAEHLLQMEAMQAKSYYESRQAAYKDDSSYLKMLPVLATAAAGVYIGVKKL